MVEANKGHLVLVDAAGGRTLLAQIAPDTPAGPGQPPSQIFNGVAIDDEGTLYVTAETSRKLLSLDATWQQASQ